MGIIRNIKVYIAAILIFCILFGTMIFVKGSIIPQIDNPIVKYSTIERTTVKTEFLYSSKLKQKHNFHSDVNSELKNMNPISVLPNKELEISFKRKPLYYMVVRQLEDGNYEKIFGSEESSGGTSAIITPSKPGKYVYSISANYSDGLGIYYFSIDVNKE